MAWDDIEFQGVRGFSGDKPMDEIGLALKRIATDYEERFSRKPFLAEILYALSIVIKAHADRLISGGYEETSVSIHDSPRTTQPGGPPISPSELEGAFTDEPEPGYYVVQTVSKDKKARRELIRIPKLEVENRTLVVEYQLLDMHTTRQQAEMLIKQIILDEFSDHYYDDLADSTSFQLIGG